MECATAALCAATLTQSIAPNYIRGRVFGVRDFISTSSAVTVNLIIWRTPDADQWMIQVLYVLSAVCPASSTALSYAARDCRLRPNRRSRSARVAW